jgi:hypothetical protein
MVTITAAAIAIPATTAIPAIPATIVAAAAEIAAAAAEIVAAGVEIVAAAVGAAEPACPPHRFASQHAAAPDPPGPT